jgi:hypothetical protein
VAQVPRVGRWDRSAFRELAGGRTVGHLGSEVVSGSGL